MATNPLTHNELTPIFTPDKVYQSLLEKSAAAYGVFDQQGRFLIGNQRCSDLFAIENQNLFSSFLHWNLDQEIIDQVHKFYFTQLGKGESWSGNVILHQGAAVVTCKVTLSLAEDGHNCCLEAVDISHEGAVISSLQRLIIDTGSVAGEDYFKTLVITLESILNASYVLVARTSEQQSRAETIAVCSGGKIIANFSYSLEGTPCQAALQQGCCIYPAGVAQAFPDDHLLSEMQIESYIGVPVVEPDGKVIGLLVALGTKELERQEYVKKIMEAFSSRAAMEFSRLKGDFKLNHVTKRLDRQVDRLRCQQEVLQQLYESQALQDGELEDVCEAICLKVAQQFDIGRVGVWFFDEAFNYLNCFRLYDLAGAQFINSRSVHESVFAEEYNHLLNYAYVDASEPYTDIRTSNYSECYLSPNKITSKLDAAIRSGDRLFGAISLEHVDKPHQWSDDEKGFSNQLGSLIAMLVANKERDETYKKLYNNEARLEALISQSPLGVVEWGTDFTIHGWNPAAEQIFGWSAEQIRELSGEVLLPEEARTQVEVVWQQLIKGQGGSFSINDNLRNDGQKITCEWNNNSLLDANGNVIGVVSFVQDVTERINAEKERISSENKFATIFATSPDAISISELESGVLLEVNRGYETTSGWKAEEVIGRSSLELDMWQSVADRESFLTQVRESGSADSCLVTLNNRYGEEIQGLLSGRIVEIEGVQRFLAYFHDVTDLKRSSDELLAANKKYEHLTAELDARVQQRTEELSHTIARMKQREFEFGLISRMQELLLSCQTREEMFDIVQKSARQLFPKGGGGVALFQPDEELLSPVVTWGKSWLLDDFSINDCWALRQGRIHETRNIKHDPSCHHFKPGFDGNNSVCLPLVVQGSTYGLLWASLGSDRNNDIENNSQLLISMADVIKLALSNLDLRSALHQQAVLDPLTGLYNRRHLEKTLSALQARLERCDEDFTLALIDIDHFKQLNDSMGHDAGDVALKALAKLLKQLSENDSDVFRYGGEEFVLLLRGKKRRQAKQKLEQIRQRWSQLRVPFGDTDLGEITMSLGAVMASDYINAQADLIAIADTGLYRAKKLGRNRLEFIQP